MSKSQIVRQRVLPPSIQNQIQQQFDQDAAQIERMVGGALQIMEGLSNVNGYAEWKALTMITTAEHHKAATALTREISEAELAYFEQVKASYLSSMGLTAAEASSALTELIHHIASEHNSYTASAWDELVEWFRTA